MRSRDDAASGPVDAVSTDPALATAFPVIAVVVLIALALTESFDALLAAVVAFASAHLILSGD